MYSFFNIVSVSFVVILSQTDTNQWHRTWILL